MREVTLHYEHFLANCANGQVAMSVQLGFFSKTYWCNSLDKAERLYQIEAAKDIDEEYITTFEKG